MPQRPLTLLALFVVAASSAACLGTVPRVEPAAQPDHAPTAHVAPSRVIVPSTAPDAASEAAPDERVIPGQVLLGAGGDDAGDVVVLTGHPQPGGVWFQQRIDINTRTSDGTWQPPLVLANPRPYARRGISSAGLALAADGTGLVAWTVQNRDGPSYAYARARRADGSWTPVRRFARGADTLGLEPTAATGGHAAVLIEGAHANRVLVRDRSGWSTIPRPHPIDVRDDIPVSALTVDGDGTLHAALENIDHGGGGTLEVTRRRPGRAWEEPEQIGSDSDPYLAGDVQLVVDSLGRERLAFGYIAGAYRVPGQSDLVGPTAWRILGQADPAGELRTVWDQRGISQVTLSVRGGRTRITWTQWHGIDARRRPRASILKTRLFGRREIAVLDRTEGNRAWLYADPVGSGRAAVAWRRSGRGEPLVTTVLNPTATTGSLILDPHSQYDAKVPVAALAAGRIWVVWQHDRPRIDHDVTSADVLVAPVG